MERESERMSLVGMLMADWPEASALRASALQVAMLMADWPLVVRLTSVAVTKPRLATDWPEHPALMSAAVTSLQRNTLWPEVPTLSCVVAMLSMMVRRAWPVVSKASLSPKPVPRRVNCDWPWAVALLMTGIVTVTSTFFKSWRRMALSLVFQPMSRLFPFLATARY